MFCFLLRRELIEFRFSCGRLLRMLVRKLVETLEELCVGLFDQSKVLVANSSNGIGKLLTKCLFSSLGLLFMLSLEFRNNLIMTPLFLGEDSRMVPLKRLHILRGSSLAPADILSMLLL